MKHQVYPYPNRALVKALYLALRTHQIDLATFAVCMRCVMGGLH
jgi:hypothetical protein